MAYINLKVNVVLKIFAQHKCFKEKIAQFQLRGLTFPTFLVRLVPYH